jgi:hypothetical protein
LFALRHLRLLALAPLVSCSVYTESMLGDSQSSVSSGGNGLGIGGSSNTAQAGKDALGGSDGRQVGDDSAGEASHGATGGSASADVGGTGSNNAGAAGGSVGGAGSGTAGTAPLAGSGGSGGSGVVVVPSGIDMLDDMEDGNVYLSPKPPRYGFWYVAGDQTVGGKLPKIEALVATFDPARNGSTSAVHFEASGFKDWGSSVGLSFADATQKRTAYDAGNALGVSFWIRGSVADNTKLKVQFPIASTDPSGKLCGGTNQGQCLDHFATQISVSSQWTQVTILFANLHQAGWGAPIDAFDARQMLGIEWSPGPANLDVWIDDLALLRP